MSIPITFNNARYVITDSKTLAKYNYLFAGYIFISGIRYKKYLINNGVNCLVEA